jgi:hypothetical protein
MGRKEILRHPTRRSKPYSTCLIFLRRRTKIILLYNKKIKGIRRKGTSQVFYNAKLFFHHCNLSDHWEEKNL